MRVPWVRFLLFVFAACGTEATNCSSIEVPEVAITYWKDFSTDASWLRTVQNANYTITGCCIHPHFPEICSKCPTYKPLTECRDNPKQEFGRICQLSHYIITVQTVSINLSITVPGCRTQSKIYSKRITDEEIKMKPVTNLSLKMQRGGEALLASWFHDDDDHLNLCYFYRALEILESQKKDEFEHGESETMSHTVTLPTGRLHAFKRFEFCVKLRYCPGTFMGKMSEEECVEIRLPPDVPSKPLEMLCGNENQEQKTECPVVEDETERNVTLFWKLPEKSSWNGLPTIIKIKIRFEGKDENYTYYRNISATNTNYTLTGLKLDGHYKIQLIFCSNGGDGPITAPIELSEIKVKRPVPVGGEEDDPTLLIIIVVAAVVLIVVVVVVFIYLLLRSKRQLTLPHLQPPRQGTAHSGTDCNLKTNPADYDFLMNNHEQEIKNKSSYEKLSCNGSSTSESTTDSASCPLVARTPDTSRDTGYDDVTHCPKKTGNESDSSLASGERTSDV
ncbi:ephrin type-A receptor 4 isoform X2 [Paramuricea clavata]|uniref:Ephrin type-A receptor 4 isoform X2 n=1 Tax=Paramuricea clavata TaxID=317549 RepID=A0A6S7I033_PARCT|nr:ephrin type-A receptor 4 isoform X2 [Paramuricea clavata]